MTENHNSDEHNGEQVTGAAVSPSNLTRGYLKLDGDAVANPKARPIASLTAMPVILHVRIPLPSFRLHALAALNPGSIVTTGWASSEDLPVTAGDIRIAWAEFAIADHKRSVRVTRIS